MNYADAVVVLDHYYFDEGHYGVGFIGNVGYDSNICGIIDCAYEDYNSMAPELQNVKSAGVAYHELSHVFNARHTDVGMDIYNNATIKYGFDDGISACYKDALPEVVEREQSYCCVNRVRNRYDNRKVLF